MSRLCVARGWAVALSGVAACCSTAPARAAELATFAPSYSNAQVMLYVSWPLGAHGKRPDTFGLRYERSSPSYPDPAAQFCPPLRHHSLVDLQFARGAAPRMQFGPRVTWDISRGRISPTNLVTAAWPWSMRPVADGAFISRAP